MFGELADAETAQQLRANMPGVRGGTEYHYVLADDGRTQAEWGVFVFDFDDEQTALDSFQYLADAVATVNKKPYASTIEDPESSEAKKLLEKLEGDPENETPEGTSPEPEEEAVKDPEAVSAGL